MKNGCFVISGPLILVATGLSSGSRKENICQVIDVSSSTSCGNLPNYPYSMYGAAGGVINNTPMICGGFVGVSERKSLESCYRFNENSNSWDFHTNMTSRRYYHAATVIQDTLFISGGVSTEFIHANGSVTNGPYLPESRYDHCMVTLHDSKVMIIGDSSSHSSKKPKSVLVLDTTDNSYTTGPSMNFNRINAACTLFHSALHDGRPVVLAAGGNGQTTAEVYDYTNTNTSQWQTSIHLNICNI